MSHGVLETLDRFSISKYRVAQLLGLEQSAIYQRVRRGTDWKLGELQIIVAFINREHDPEFTLEDLVGGVEQDPAPQDLPQTDPTAGLTPRGGRAA